MEPETFILLLWITLAHEISIMDFRNEILNIKKRNPKIWISNRYSLVYLIRTVDARSF